MYLGFFEGEVLTFEQIKSPILHFQESNSECIVIGEILSFKDDVYWGFKKFLQDPNPHHILFFRGNYQTIIRKENNLWLFADISNVRPIYYFKQGSSLLFSSHLGVLQEKVLHSEININWFRRFLATSGFHIEMESPFQHIFTIPGAFGLCFSARQTNVFQAWNVDDEQPLSLEEAKKELRDELTASVLLRCRNKRVTSDLSGGLDSSTITWIAAKEHSIKSITVIGKEEVEDIRIAREIVKKQKNIQHFEMKQEKAPIYSKMEEYPSDFPIPFLWSANSAIEIIRWAKEQKSELHFSGEGGDSVLESSFDYLVDLIQQRKWRKFFDDAQAWAQVKKQSPWSWIAGGIRLAIGLPFKPKDRHLLAITNNFANWFLFSTEVNRGQYSKYKGVSSTLQGIHNLGYISNGLRNLAEQEGLPVSVPYLDHNVLRVSMRTPSEYKMSPYELKPLLKRAFQGDLPDCLLTRNSKGDFTPDVYDGMKRRRSWFESYFKNMILSDVGLIDLDKFHESLNKMALGAPVKLPELHQTMSLEIWLRHYFERGKHCEIPDTIAH